MLLAVPALAFLHDAALQFSPFGGHGLPRYLIYTFPFVLAPLGLVYRRLPLTTLALAGVSTIQMALMTATNPLAAYDLDWVGRVSRREFSQNGAAFVEVTGWYTIALFFAAVAVAAVAAVVLLPRPTLEPVDGLAAAAALALWALVATLARTPDGGRHDLGYVLAVVVAAALPPRCSRLDGFASSRAERTRAIAQTESPTGSGTRSSCLSAGTSASKSRSVRAATVPGCGGGT